MPSWDNIAKLAALTMIAMPIIGILMAIFGWR